MAAVCDICGKHPGFGMKVSFSHKAARGAGTPTSSASASWRGAPCAPPQRLHLLHQGQQGPPGRSGPAAGLGFGAAAVGGFADGFAAQ